MRKRAREIENTNLKEWKTSPRDDEIDMERG